MQLTSTTNTTQPWLFWVTLLWHRFFFWWLNHNSGASSFPKTEPSKPFSVSYCLAATHRKQTITVSKRASQEGSRALFSYPSSAPPQNPVIITGQCALARSSLSPTLPSLLLLSLSCPPSLLFLCASRVSSSHRIRAHVSNKPLRAYLQENPLRWAPPLSVSCRPHSFMTPYRWRRRFHGAYCRRQ